MINSFQIGSRYLKVLYDLGFRTTFNVQKKKMDLELCEDKLILENPTNDLCIMSVPVCKLEFYSWSINMTP